jgi:hypothetical protein
MVRSHGVRRVDTEWIRRSVEAGKCTSDDAPGLGTSTDTGQPICCSAILALQRRSYRAVGPSCSYGRLRRGEETAIGTGSPAAAARSCLRMHPPCARPPAKALALRRCSGPRTRRWQMVQRCEPEVSRACTSPASTNGSSAPSPSPLPSLAVSSRAPLPRSATSCAFAARSGPPREAGCASEDAAPAPAGAETPPLLHGVASTSMSMLEHFAPPSTCCAMVFRAVAETRYA